VTDLGAAVRPFDDLVRGFLDYLDLERGLSSNTLDAYRGDLAQFGRHLGRADAAALGPDDLAGFLAALGARHPPASPATIQRKAACLRSFYRHLRRAGHLAEDPTAGLRCPPKDHVLPRVLTRSEVARLLAVPRGRGPGPLRDRALLELMYASGLRASEAIGLHAVDLDPDGRTLRIRGSRERVVPVGRSARTAVRAYLDRARPGLVDSPEEPHLFVNLRGAGLTRQGLYKIVQARAAGAGLAGRMSPNTLRQTFAAHALADGRDIRVLQEILGHADPATTRLYRQVAVGA
jgi:integrase/recombinase XerD